MKKRAWLKWLGLGVLMLLLLVAGIALRFWLQHAEHKALREADEARAPVVAKRRPGELHVPASPTAQTGCVRGVVLKAGQPVPGMQVSVSSTDFSVSADCPCPSLRSMCACREGLEALIQNPNLGLIEPVLSVTSGPDGRFELCGLTGNEDRLVWAEDSTGAVALLAAKEFDGVAKPGATVTLEVQPPQHIEGVVLAGNEPVPHATVLTYALPALSVRAAETDARGRFTVELPGSAPWFVVSAPGFPAQRHPSALTAGLAVLRLENEGQLEVLTTFEGKPLDGVEVKAYGTAALTGKDGLARFMVRTGTYIDVSATKGELLAGASPEVTPRGTRIELKLIKGVRVRGAVRDEHGQPRQATIHGFGEPVKTDAEGRFVSPPLMPGEKVSPNAEAEGCARSPYKAVVPRDGLELTLNVACTETVTGVVLDAEGAPVSNAQVTLEGATTENVKTSLDGRFAFHSPPGGYQLKVKHERYRGHEQPLEVPAAEVTVVLDAGGSISGVVLDGSGQPVNGAELVVMPALLTEAISSMEGGTPEATSGADGRYELTGVRAGRLMVMAISEKHGTAASEVVVLQPGEHREGVEVRVVGEVSLTGTVRDERGRPVAGARVSWKPADEKALAVAAIGSLAAGDVGAVLALAPIDGFTGADGRFALKNIAVSSVKLTVYATGFEQAQLDAETGKEAEITLTAENGGVVSGRVVDEAGRPVERFEVDFSTFTPADGRFEKRVEGSKVSLSVRATGYVRTDVDTELRDGASDVGDVVLRREQQLRVEVVNESGAAVEGAYVSAKQQGSGGTCNTGADGKCTLKGLLPGEVRLGVSRRGYKKYSNTLSSPGADERVRLEAVHGKLKGIAYTHGGRPLPVREVSLSGEVSDSVTTDAQGRFEFYGLPEGNYCATLDLPGSRMFEWAVPATAGAQPTELHLGPTGTAKVTGNLLTPGRVLLVSGTSAPLEIKESFDMSAHRLCLRTGAQVVANVVTGEFSIEGLSPGTWSAYTLSISRFLETAPLQPEVFTLLPGDTKRLR